MLAIHSITTQLRKQTLTEPAASGTSPAIVTTPATVVTEADSSQDDNALKIRHHSEPHPPQSTLPDTVSTKKVKVITFEDGVVQNVSSLLLTAKSTSSSWDPSSSNPPNKRQCRSMSIPNDRELQSQWLQTQRRLHKPLALRPNSGSRSKSHHYNHHQRSSCTARLPPVWSASLAPSDMTSPPESPRSRPSSASSGYFDSPLTSSSNLNRNRCQSLHALQALSPHMPNPTTPTDQRLIQSPLSAKSMPSVSLDSLQYSPHKQLLRCQSQPCVAAANERRCGMKRRYHEDLSRPSINFTKMTETAVIQPGAATPDVQSFPSDSFTTTTLPLAIRPPNRYSGGVGGLIFPDRVLQTIASSPQDAVPVGGSSVSSDNPDSSSVTMLSSPPTSPIRLPPSSADDDSDSGCSTTDDELCQITDGFEPDVPGLTSDDTADSTDFCHHCSLRPITCEPPTTANHARKCDCYDVARLSDGAVFTMDSGGLVPDGELDIDMIENN